MDSEYKEYPCDLCQSWEAVEVPFARLYTNDQPIHICKKCGFVYVRMRRSPEKIADAWSEELYGDEYTARIPAVKARQVYVADFIDTTIGLKGKTLMDIGAGEGQFLEIIRDLYRANVFGIEPSGINCNKMSAARIDCFQGTIEEYMASGQVTKVNIVTVIWTLENCNSCRAMLEGAHRMLGTDGHVVVATGSRILVPFKKPLFDYLGDNPSDTHCFRFSANSLKGLLAISGFEPLEINRYLDTDVLCVIARKADFGQAIQWEGDNYLDIHNFFERWHHESMFYLHR